MVTSNPKRRVFFLAVNTGYVVGGQPDGRFVKFYRERSGNDLYCAIVGNVVIPAGFGSNQVSATIADSAVWREVASAISSQGAKPGVQLASAWQGYSGIRKFVPANRQAALSDYLQLAGSFDVIDVTRAFDALMHASDVAMECGFSHLQLHAAHGYLFNLLLDARISRHHKLAECLAKRWAEHMASNGIETSLRASIRTGEPNFDAALNPMAIGALCAIGVDYIDLSEGFYNVDKRLIYPASDQQVLDRYSRCLQAAKANPQQLFILSGKILRVIDDRAPANVHIGICRDLIANPLFLVDRKSGCKNRMKCHYHSRGAAELACGQWVS